MQLPNIQTKDESENESQKLNVIIYFCKLYVWRIFYSGYNFSKNVS